MRDKMSNAITTSFLSAIILFGTAACSNREPPAADLTTSPAQQQTAMAITNPQIKSHAFLECMVHDDYFPKHLVEQGKQILIRLCEQIEKQRPADEQALYALTHSATEEFNELAQAFEEADSEIETMARDCIGADFDFIAKSYGFISTDAEELIANRDW